MVIRILIIKTNLLKCTSKLYMYMYIFCANTKKGKKGSPNQIWIKLIVVLAYSYSLHFLLIMTDHKFRKKCYEYLLQAIIIILELKIFNWQKAFNAIQIQLSYRWELRIRHDQVCTSKKLITVFKVNLLLSLFIRFTVWPK